MQNIFRRDSFLANPAFSEGNVFRNSRIEVMGNHHHIEGLIKRIYAVWPSWSRRRWNNVWLATYFDDVRGVSATRPFRVKRVNRPAFEGGDCIFDETALVQRVGVNENLHIHVIGNGQATIDGGGRCTPVLMKFEAKRSRLDLLNEARCRARVAFAEKAEIHGKAIGCLQHLLDVPRTWSTGCRIRSNGRSCASTHHRGQAPIKSFFHFFWGDVMN